MIHVLDTFIYMVLIYRTRRNGVNCESDFIILDWFAK